MAAYSIQAHVCDARVSHNGQGKASTLLIYVVATILKPEELVDHKEVLLQLSQNIHH